VQLICFVWYTRKKLGYFLQVFLFPVFCCVWQKDRKRFITTFMCTHNTVYKIYHFFRHHSTWVLPQVTQTFFLHFLCLVFSLMTFWHFFRSAVVDWMWYQNNVFTWINNKKEVCKVNKGFKTEILCLKYEWHSTNNRQPLMVIGQL
jgi:hypothetical protein